MTFRGITYGYLQALDPDGCEEITVQIQRKCGGTFTTYLTGHFNAGDWRDNQDDCEITVKVQTNDQYECLLGSWKTPINMYDLDIVEVEPYSLTEEYITTTLASACTDCNTIPSPPGDYCAVPETAFCVPNLTCPGAPFTNLIMTWHRIEGTGTCSGATPVAPTPDSYWELLTDNCPTDSTWWRCPGNDLNEVNAKLASGRLFSDVLEALFAPCGLTVVSDFFNINPDASAPSNDAYTYAATYLQNMTVHQKSDVKRPYSSNPATSKQWDMQPNEMLEDLRILFNVYWDISGTDIRIEHISYFETTGGIDVSGDPQKLDTERQIEDDIKSEYFFFMDEAGSDYFLGSPIVYDCGTEKQENRCTMFSTDVTYIHYTNSEGFSDEGFVLCSNEIVDTVYRIIRDNRPLSFTELHEDLHRHYRYWKTGTLNGSPVTFTSFRPTRKQPAFDHKLCCSDTFNEREPITTGIGEGFLETALYDIQNDIITLEIKH